MIVPSLILAFSNIDYWQVGLTASIILGTLQWLFPQGHAVVPSEPLKFSSLAVVIPIAILICIKAAMAVASTPYDGDSITYHLPMAVAFIQHHTALHQVMYHPGNSELLDSIGLASLGAVGGQSLMEGVVAFSFFLTAYGFARNLRAPQIVCLAAASAVLSMPIVADQLLTGENDVLVATLLLALAALWQFSPALAAVALGLLAGTKFTGALEGVALIAILWPRRNKALSWKHLFIALSIATPWYVRNWIETGNPVFLGAQTAGFTSTLAAHFLSAGPYIFSAFRNYMGLLAILGVIAIVPLARDKKLQATLAPILPGLLLLMAAVWLITPNVAETTHGTLDQIRSGWSIRYVIIAGALLTTGSIIWITRLSTPLAIAVASITVIAASLRELKSSTSLDPSVSNFLTPVLGNCGA